MNRPAKERARLGKSRREHVSRGALAELHPKQRAFDPIGVLRASTEGRVPQLLPLKYARMKESPFAFFRGAVSIMAADLGRLVNSGLQVQLCGDAHVQNLGSFATPDGKLVFDLNDFDETIRGPWEWDVKRMATSIILAGQECGHNRPGCRDAATTFVESYCRSIATFSELPILGVARYQIHREKRIQPIQAALRQSERARPLDLLNRFTENGQPRRSGDFVTCGRGFGGSEERKLRRFLDRWEPIAQTWRLTAAICSICSTLWMSGSRWWVQAASGCGIMWSCLKGTAPRIRCSCRLSRKSHRRMRMFCPDRIPVSTASGAPRGRGTARGSTDFGPAARLDYDRAPSLSRPAAQRP